MKQKSINLSIDSLQTTDSIFTKPIMWNNQLVMTFKMIDKLHHKKAEITKHNFYKYKKTNLLVQDKNYYILTRKDIQQFLSDNKEFIDIEEEFNNINKINKLIVVNKQGYLVLIKNSRDRLSKQINSYISFNIYQTIIEHYKMQINEQAKQIAELEHYKIQVNEQSKQIIELQEQITDYKMQVNEQSKQIIKLQEQIVDYKMQRDKYFAMANPTIINLDKIIIDNTIVSQNRILAKDMGNMILSAYDVYIPQSSFLLWLRELKILSRNKDNFNQPIGKYKTLIETKYKQSKFTRDDENYVYTPMINTKGQIFFLKIFKYLIDNHLSKEDTFNMVFDCEYFNK